MSSHTIHHQQHVHSWWAKEGRSHHHAGTQPQSWRRHHLPCSLLRMRHPSRLHCRVGLFEGQQSHDHESSVQRRCASSHVSRVPVIRFFWFFCVSQHGCRIVIHCNTGACQHLDVECIHHNWCWTHIDHPFRDHFNHSSRNDTHRQWHPCHQWHTHHQWHPCQ